MVTVPLTEAALVPAHVSMPERRVLPQCVFAAGRQRFECVVRGCESTIEAEIAILDEVPLEANGWDMDALNITLLRTEFGEMTFLVERG